MHHHEAAAWVGVLNTVSNLVIVAGYLLIPFTVLRRLPLTLFVRVSGVFFFLGCAISHSHMACEAHPPVWLAISHAVQAVAVWCFVLGFVRLASAAFRIQRAAPPRHVDGR